MHFPNNKHILVALLTLESRVEETLSSHEPIIADCCLWCVCLPAGMKHYCWLIPGSVTTSYEFTGTLKWHEEPLISHRAIDDFMRVQYRKHGADKNMCFIFKLATSSLFNLFHISLINWFIFEPSGTNPLNLWPLQMSTCLPVQPKGH